MSWLGFFDWCLWVCWVDGFGSMMGLIGAVVVDGFEIGDGLMVGHGGGSMW